MVNIVRLRFFISLIFLSLFWPCVISVCSLMYCVKFLVPLRGKFGFYYRRKLRRLSRAGKGSEDSGGYGLDFLQKATKRTKVFGAAEDKAFVSFVVFCLESSPVLRAPTLPGAPRHPDLVGTTTFMRRLLITAVTLVKRDG